MWQGDKVNKVDKDTVEKDAMGKDKVNKDKVGKGGQNDKVV